MKVFAENRKARNSYEFLEFFEAGVVLTPPNISAKASNNQKVKKLVSERTNQTIIARNTKTKTDSKIAFTMTRRKTGSGN